MSSSWGPGTVILGRYRLESLLGRGGMGSVYRAEHLQLKSPVAVKLLDPAIASNQQILGRFMREAQSAAALRSQHVVQIFDYGVEDGNAFIVMELLQGESLSDRIARLGKLQPDEAFRYLAQVLRAIGKAHEAGIVHRDLKPDNVFICQDEPEYAKVLDFGVAKVSENGEFSSSKASRTQTGMMIGTPYYMSPEQTQAKEVDARADLWAIAVMAFECLTGQRPFTGDSFGELVIAICTKPVPVPSRVGPVPAGFDEWFVKGTQRDRERRFQSAREMADELAKIAGMPPIGTARIAAPALTSAAPRPAEALQMTTGSRAVTSGSVRAAESRTTSVTTYVLAGIAALIVAGVGSFYAFGGPAALRSASSAEPAAAEQAVEAPAIQPQPAPAPVESAAAPAPSASESAAVPPPSASSSALPAPPAQSESKPAASADAGKKAAPVKPKEALPPKNWDF